jgi:hypothetical protein
MATIKQPFGSDESRTTINVGTVNLLTGLTAVEDGNGHTHRTVFTLDALALGSSTGAAALGFGKLLYTLPAGACIIRATKMNVALNGAVAIQADTPDFGLGTVIATGVVSVLSGTATFENILTGQTVADCNGTATVKTTLATASPFGLIVEAADAHTIHLNIADTWAAAGAVTATGTIVIEWDFIG